MNTAQLKTSQVSDAFEIMKEKIISYEWIQSSFQQSNCFRAGDEPDPH